MNQNKNQGMSFLPEHVRAKLAKYGEHEQLTCLECGYSGLMGVLEKKDRVSFKKSLGYFAVAGSITAFLTLFAGIPWWSNLVVGIGVAIFTAGSIKTYECPNCNTSLSRK